MLKKGQAQCKRRSRLSASPIEELSSKRVPSSIAVAKIIAIRYRNVQRSSIDLKENLICSMILNL